jgi:enhancing lycopene biosynthesis protein 2
MNIGLLLAGCGYLDGAEIQEGVSAMIALSELGATILPLAVDMPQHHVIDHQSGSPVEESRNVLTETARITRGSVVSLDQLDLDSLDALVIAGGFGVAKNYCDFAFKGTETTVHPAVASLIKNCHEAKKPIGAMCIAPALLAAVLGQTAPVTLTIGNDPGTAQAIEAFGCRHVPCPVDQCVIDEAHKVVSTPAYMLGRNAFEVFSGIRAMCQALPTLL